MTKLGAVYGLAVGLTIVGSAIAAANSPSTGSKASAASAPKAQSALAPSASATPAAILIPSLGAGKWAGQQGNVPSVVFGGWGRDGHVFITTRSAVYHSADNGQKWAEQRLAIEGNVVWGSSADNVYIAGSGLVRSTDRGNSWTMSKPFPKGSVIGDLWGTNESELYAVGSVNMKPMLLRSKDGGKTFTKLSIGLQNGWLYTVTGDGGDVFVMGHKNVGSETVGVLLLTKDRGAHFKAMTVPKSEGKPVSSIHDMCLTSSGRMFLLTTYDLFRSDDRGQTWQVAAAAPNTELLALACAGREVFFGGRNRLFRHSRDNGDTWNEHVVDALWTEQAMSAVQGAFATDSGEIYLYGEGTYTKYTGTVFRRSK